MNYIKHTIAAHERLRQQPDVRPQHIALYWALFFAWNAEYFDKDGLSMDHQALMQAARIGNERTYRATLYELETWALLTYQPSKSRHSASYCVLHDLSGAKVPQVKPPTEGTSAPDETGLSGAEVPEALRAEVPPIKPLPGAEVPEHSLLVQTSFQTSTTNVGGGTKKKIGEVFSGEGFSEVQEVTAADNLTTPGAAPKKKVAPKKKGVHEATIREAATRVATADPNELRRRGGRPRRPEVPFDESDLKTPEDFAAAFVGTDFELADLRYYHALVANWRKDGEPPLRRDWKATATKFMLNDAADNRLKIATNVQRHDGGLGSSTGNPGGSTTGYRSSRWDT